MRAESINETFYPKHAQVWLHGHKNKKISRIEPTVTKAMHLIFKRMQISALLNHLTQPGLSTLLSFISRAAHGKELMESYLIFKCIQTRQVQAFIQTWYEYWKPCFVSTKLWSKGLMDVHLCCYYCNLSAIWRVKKRPLHLK